MVNRSAGVATLGLLAILGAGCGGGASSPFAPAAPTPTPAPAPTPTPTPAPTPAPAPTPSPCTQGLCEPPVANTAPPVRLTLRLYAVEDGLGNFFPEMTELDEIPVGFIARLDVTAKDEDDAETNGTGKVRFFFSDPTLVKVTGNHPFQRRLTILKPGRLDCQAELDSVQSNVLTLKFKAQ